MSGPKSAFTKVDEFQQRQPALALPIAVWKKFGNDSAGYLAALIAYYGFIAIFPLLLVLVTVLNLVLKNDPSLRASLLNSALSQYPIVGTEIKGQLGSVSGAGVALALGVIVLFLGARSVAAAMQNALCGVWGIAKQDRPSFVLKQLWGILLMLDIGLGFCLTTFLSGLAGGTGHVLSGAGAHVGAVAVSLGLNVGVFWIGFRLATMHKVPWLDLWIGATAAAIVWQVLQVAGGYVISHDLKQSSQLYGTFGVVLGLLAWLYLQAELTLYAAQIDVVLVRRLWPVSLATKKPAEPETAPAAGPGAREPRPPRAADRFSQPRKRLVSLISVSLLSLSLLRLARALAARRRRGREPDGALGDN